MPLPTKDGLRNDFAKNYQAYFEVPLFKKEGFERHACKSCGKHYWATEGNEAGQTSCGDSSHTKYSFFQKTPKKIGYGEFWRKFEGFWKKHGHATTPRYPVVARWRDDLYFNIASIVDFQRLENGKIGFEWPANPLIVPQMCLRFGDLANVGITGRHLSCFMMAGQHAFNPPKEGYWKDQCIELNYAYLTEVLGVKKNELTYGEDLWAMPDFSSYGPCIESFSKGVELVNSVFTEFWWDETNNAGKGQQKELALKVIDVGWGFDRLLWFYTGAPTVYDAVFPREIEHMKKRASLDLNPELLSKYASLAATLDIESAHTFGEEKRKIAKELGITHEQLEKGIAPMQGIYAIGDHSRSLLFAFADGALPSNTAGGYNLRVMARRALGFINDYEFDFDLVKLMEMHADDLKDLFPELKEAIPEAHNILEAEKRKYDNTLVKARGIAGQVISRSEKTGKAPTVDELAVLYESNGLTPEILERVAKEQKKKIEIPADYYSKVTGKHIMAEKTKVPRLIAEGHLPATRMLYYEKQDELEAKGKIEWVSVEGHQVVVDQTPFYPEGGGQMFDKGVIVDSEGKIGKVLDGEKVHGVSVHHLQGNHGTQCKVGQTVTLKVDKVRRAAIMRHHSATHVVLQAAMRVLGPHVWQTGSNKDEDVAHVDITHFEKITRDQKNEIERLANEVVKANQKVTVLSVDRGVAEQKWGFRIYQGSGAIGKVLRVIDIKEWDTECCGGTHVRETSEIGRIKITGVESIQDGVIRLYYMAGPAALAEIQKQEALLDEACAKFACSRAELLGVIDRLQGEWKERGKTVERLVDELGKYLVDAKIKEHKGKDVVIHWPNAPFTTPAQLSYVGGLFKEAGAAAVISNASGFVVTVGNKKHNAVDLLKESGAKGGGRADFAQGKLG